MSTQSSQTGARKTNGASSAPSQPNGSAKGKEPSKNASSRGGRGRRQPSHGEKVVVRRLPPGMTETEFIAILGAEWQVGKGKVDWIQYAEGRIPKDSAKPAIPARCSIHVMKKDNIVSLGDAVKNAIWEDAKGTFTSPSLVGPPVLELSVYKKVPSNKKRADTRQGTIDQDPEYMAFLESLTKPDKLPENAADADIIKTEKVTSTPLTEFLKEKKANKGRDAAKNAKNSRQASAAATKGKGAGKEEESSKRRGRGEKEKGSKETVKILTKKANDQKSETEKKADATASANAASDAPKSRRAGIAAAARLLQRDLGLSPGTAHRRARQEAAKADGDAKPTATAKENVDPNTASASTPTPTPTSTANDAIRAKMQAAAAAAPKAQAGRRGRGGKNAEKGKTTESTTPAPPAITPTMILKKKPETEAAPAEAKAANAGEKAVAATEASTPASAANGKASAKNGGGRNAQKKGPTISAGATRGFVKHANASQGITELNLKEAMQAFGTVSFVEIDKRKGFAYVDFAEHDSLVKAAAASPVSVAQGAVQVLERKDKKPAAATPASGAATQAPSSTGAASASGSVSAPAAEGAKSNGGRGRRGRGGGRRNNAGGAKDGNAGEQAAPAVTSTNGGG